MTAPALCRDPACRPVCRRYAPLPGRGWTCIEYPENAPANARPATPRQPGWSAPPAVIPCPGCRNRAYSVPAAEGFPWRRCDGPAGCGHVWNPEEDR